MAAQNIYNVTLSNTSATYTIPLGNIPDIIIITPNTNPLHLSHVVTFQFSGTPTIGDSLRVIVNAGLYFSGGLLNLFGTITNASNAYIENTWEYVFTFTDNVGTYEVSINPLVIGQDGSSSASQVINGQFIVDNSLSLTAFDGANSSGDLIIGSNTIFNGKYIWQDVSLSGDATINYNGLLTIANGAVTNAKVANAAAIAVNKLAALTVSQVVETDGSGFLTTAATLSPLLGGLGADNSASTGFVTFNAGTASVGSAKFSRDLSVSFTPSGVGDYKIMMAGAGTVVKIYAFVDFPIGNAVYNIVPKNNAGTTMGSGTITGLSGDPKGTAYTSTPSTNNTFVDGDILTFSSSGGNGQGVVHLSIIYTKNS